MTTDVGLFSYGRPPKYWHPGVDIGHGKIKASVRVTTVAAYRGFSWLASSSIYDSYLTIHVDLLWCLKLVDTTVRSRNFAHFPFLISTIPCQLQYQTRQIQTCYHGLTCTKIGLNNL